MVCATQPDSMVTCNVVTAPPSTCVTQNGATFACAPAQTLCSGLIDANFASVNAQCDGAGSCVATPATTGAAHCAAPCARHASVPPRCPGRIQLLASSVWVSHALCVASACAQRVDARPLGQMWEHVWALERTRPVYQSSATLTPPCQGVRPDSRRFKLALPHHKGTLITPITSRCVPPTPTAAAGIISSAARTLLTHTQHA